ncbi:phytoene/squalene synthase family protein [Natrialba sp. PRR66]|uniref:phytoene/squalene synthase family protein n=1 Tax=Natrialba sp. PRR66 TaxID=3098146 RepID=UPI002B1D34FA|nr:phytoene/squalene synthase family protein [Natrialba sp. PRR66]
MHRKHIAASKELHRRTGKTFYLATKFLPRRVRRATYVLYAFFRLGDEIVDDADDVPPATQRAELESLRAQALGEIEPEGPVLAAFQDIRERYDIPESEIDLFIDAMATDVATARYETAAALHSYMRGSAAAVGVMMTAIMEPELEAMARPHAVKLGEAFQMTNFLRDVREDIVERNRIYLPQETLRKHGVSNEQLEALEFNESFAAVIADELQRTEALYREGVAGIRYLPADCQFPVLLAAVLYAEYHARIRAQGYDVLSSEPSLSTARKLRCLVRTRWHWQWNRDPEAVFRRVSAVPAIGTDSHGSSRGEGTPMR